MITEKTLTVKEQVAEDGYLIKVSNDLFVEKITFAATQEGFEEVKIEEVPEELRPGDIYVSPEISKTENNLENNL
jgi:hypothetical protein